jgi:spore maturation protein SpmA
MLNVIWLVMILVAVLVGGFMGKSAAMTEGAFSTAKSAVMDIALPLVGLMAIWLGMMRLAERAGLVQLLARGLRPLMRRLFPEVPPEHPAQGAMVLNMAANMLGLGNAATPLGLRAMALLQKLNPHPAVASNAMVTFLAVNTASIQLVPTTAISILAIQGSKNPSSIVVPAMIATTIAMTCGILVAKWLSSWRVFQIPADEPRAEASADSGSSEDTTTEFVEPPAVSRRGRILLVGFLIAFATLWVLTWVVAAFPDAMVGFKPADLLRGVAMQKLNPSSIAAHVNVTHPALAPAITWISLHAVAPSVGLAMLQALGLLAVPFLLAFFPLYAFLRGVKVYEQFCDGAKEAFATAQRIIPFLVAMLVAIRLLREAGVIQLVTNALQPLLAAIGFPADLLPLALLRPLSGSASQGIFVDLVTTHGADTLLAKMAATIYGSTETTFYVLAVYFGSVAVRKTRHAIIAGLTADIVAIFASIFICRWLLG